MDKKLRQPVMIPVIVILCLFSGCGNCDFSRGETVASPSRQYAAFTKSSDCGPLLSELDSFVEIEHAYHVLGLKLWTTRKTVARGKLAPSLLMPKWLDDRHLLVDCRCQKESLDFAIGNWRELTIIYTFSH